MLSATRVAATQLSELRQQLLFDAAATGLLANQGEGTHHGAGSAAG